MPGKVMTEAAPNRSEKPQSTESPIQTSIGIRDQFRSFHEGKLFSLVVAISEVGLKEEGIPREVFEF